MPQHSETTFFNDIETISKQVIQPISCSWSGCTATINSWLTLQKHLQLHCQINAVKSTSKDDVVMTCQINECQDFEHHSLMMLENHINKCHLNLIHIPCPALGCFYTAAASQSQHSHFLAKHPRLLYVNPQSHLFKLQAFPSSCQLPPPQSLPLDLIFPSYKLIPYISTSRSYGISVSKGLNSLTQSISSLKVSHNSDDKQQMAKRYMALSTQHTPILSDSQIDFTLSAPPSWRLQIDRPTSTPQTVGYSAFITLCQLSQRVAPDN